MDFKKILASFDAVENDTSAGSVEKKRQAGSMLAILESFNRVEAEAVEESRLSDMMIAASEMSKEEFAKEYPAFAKDYEKLRKQQMADESVEEAAEETDDKLMGYDPLIQGFGKGVSDEVNDVAATMEEDPQLADFAYDFEKTVYSADEQNADTIRKALELVLPSALHSKIEDLMKVIESVETEEELEEAIMVSAEGDEAAQLLSILQLAGMSAPAPAMPAPMEPEIGPEMDMQDEYSNSPDEVEQDVDAVIASGDDLHREKDQYAASARGDNPMKAFEGKFKSILDELLAEDEK